MEKVKVLEVSGTMNRAGQETFLMNVLRAADREKFEYHFSVNTSKKGHYDDEIIELGGYIFRNIAPSFSSIPKYISNLRKYLREHGPFNAVHSHVYWFSGFIMLAAYLENIPVRITHSHNTDDGRTNSVLRSFYRYASKYLIKKYSTHLFGCSEAAIKSLYGDDYKVDNRIKLINNAIITDEFNVEEIDVIKVKKELGIKENNIVLTNISRFFPQKNHEYLIDLFNAFLKDSVNEAYEPVLLLVGTGELEQFIKDKVKDLGIEKNVIFTGLRSDIKNILGMTNVLLMPSKFEGLPVVLVEAQASGTPCVISDTITKEVDLDLNLVEFVSLKNGFANWEDKIRLSLNKQKPPFSSRKYALEKKGYDIDGVTSFLQMIYQGKGHM